MGARLLTLAICITRGQYFNQAVLFPTDGAPADDARSAVFIRPLASAGLDGIATTSPGRWAHIAW